VRTILRQLFWITLVTLLIGAVGCKPKETGAPQVVATTTMIADTARVIAGDRVKVVSILKPGGDPHVYQPVPSDSKKVARSKLVLMNGLKLEGWMEDLARNAGGDVKVITVTQGITPLDDPAHPGNPDPHVWFDVQRWIMSAKNIRDALKEIDPEGAAGYDERAAAYIQKLEALDAKIKKAIACIPADKRVVVTSHDAFQYFGHAYGLEVRAVQGISTESEASAAELRDVIDFVRAKNLPAVFIETSVSEKNIEAVTRETNAKVGGTLYSDSLGPSDSPAATYITMVEHNTETLVQALSGRSLDACLSASAPASPKAKDTP